jgi:hypothetical protein
MTYAISIAPSAHGKVTATSSDGHTFTTSTCLLDGARYRLSQGVVTVWSSGSSHWALRSTIGHAAKLTVSTNQSGTPIFVPNKGQ